MAKQGVWTVCSRRHRFYKTAARPVCPKCWPGRYRKNASRRATGGASPSKKRSAPNARRVS